MYRSASANRIWDRQLSRHHHPHHRHRSEDFEDLPTYDPFSESAKKGRTVARFAAYAVHAIPFMLLFCAFLLWFFSSPTGLDWDETIVVRKFEGLKTTIDGDLDSDGTGHTPLDVGNMNPLEVGNMDPKYKFYN